MSVVLRPDHHAPIRPRSSPEVIKALASRLTERDRWIMRLIWRHQVFTTDQLTTLGWNCYNTGRQRLNTLYRLRALDRVRPWKPVGGAPWHYILDTPGAEILAAEDGLTLRQFGYRHDRALPRATSATLAHLLGINDVFVSLQAHARDHEASLQWWTEAECAELWGDIVRPDAAGRWSVDDRSVNFFLEHDTGTERLRTLIRKIDAYAELTEITETHGIVLFSLPSHQREAHLRRTLGAHPPVPVATTTHHTHPAEQVWTRVDDPELCHQYLIDLYPHPHQPTLFDLDATDSG